VLGGSIGGGKNENKPKTEGRVHLLKTGVLKIGVWAGLAGAK
jgi:hypothetical protein